MSYRTLVKLADSDAGESDRKGAVSDNSDWQVTAYSMSCKLLKDDQVSRLDDKGVSREYRENSLTKRQ